MKTGVSELFERLMYNLYSYNNKEMTAQDMSSDELQSREGTALKIGSNKEHKLLAEMEIFTCFVSFEHRKKNSSFEQLKSIIRKYNIFFFSVELFPLLMCRTHAGFETQK